MPVDLTAAETQVGSLFAKLSVAQPTAGRFVQVRDADSEWLAKAAVTRAERSGLACVAHEYEGRVGRGWSFIATLADVGGVWVRIRHVGPEKWRETPWAFSPVPR